MKAVSMKRAAKRIARSGWPLLPLPVLVMVAFLVAGAVPLGAAAWPEARLMSGSAEAVTFTVPLGDYVLEPVSVEGRTYVRIVATGLVPFAAEGEPNVPVVPVMLAVPPGAVARVTSAELVGETAVDGVRVVPVEAVRAVLGDAGKFATSVYAEEVTAYGGDQVFPRQVAWVAGAGRLRHQDVARILVAPVRYDPRNARLTVAREVRVTVVFEGRTGMEEGSPGAIPPEDAWEGVYRGTLLNYDQGRRWRTTKAGTRRAAPLAAETGNQRVKITVRESGMRQVAFNDLAVLGFPSGVAWSQVYLYRDEFRDGSPDTLVTTEWALAELDNDSNGIFSPGDALRFYALDFYDAIGRQGNEDTYDNKNVYWLSWGTGEHRRTGSRSGWRDAAGPVRPSHFPDFIHVEQDSYFVVFPPRGDTDLYAWTSRRRITPFSLPGIDPGQGTALTVNFISFYTEPRGLPATSSITLYVTGCSSVQTEVGSVTTAIPAVKKSTVALAAGLLCETGNRFRFESSLLSETPGNMLDWFEVAYQRKYTALDDVLRFTNGGALGEVEFEVGGFSSAAISIYDVTDPTRAVRLGIPPERIVDDGGTFKVTFQDSLAGLRQYIAVGAAGAAPIPAADLALRTAPRLRQAAADYLIVTYPDFAADLAPLVERREAQGHTVLLATTDEVYDDFGNGLRSDLAVRRFFRQGFYAGDAVFALLVGDANVDHRGVLISPPPGFPVAQRRSGIDYVPSHDIARDDGLAPNKEWRAVENWFATVDADDDYPDLYLGRFPVGSTSETRGLVEKILTFEDAGAPDPWKRRLVLVADDEYKYDVRADGSVGPDCWNASDPSFAQACDTVASIAANLALVPPDTVKYYLARCTQDDQPDQRCKLLSCCTDVNATQTFTRSHCTPELISLMNAGALLINYQGHANRSQFTHENLILEYQSLTDIRGLTNEARPFIFAGYSCWISDFDYRTEPDFQDAIGEKFVLNPGGGACATFASACSEQIYTNRVFNPYVARALFTNPPVSDAQGDQVPARALLGEVTLTALVRFGVPDYAQRYILFGDPAMVIDMGPPRISATVDGAPADSDYVFQGAVLDTLDVVAEIEDEEAITEISFEIVAGDVATPVAADSVVTEPLVDPGLKRARAYRATYHHVPLLGNYSLRIVGADYSGRVSSLAIGIATGSANFFRDESPLAPGGTLAVGQVLRAVITRPFPASAAAIEVTIDGVPAGDVGEFDLQQRDGEGKQWEASLVPTLAAGGHEIEVEVSGFKARRNFVYVPVRVDFLAGGRTLFENDFIAGDALLGLVVRTVGEVAEDDIEVDLDGAPVDVDFEPDLTRTVWTGALDLGGLAPEPGSHELAVTVQAVGVTRSFRISEGLSIVDVSAYPNPFSSATYFFYTLTEEASEARLAIYTVSGRKVLDAAVETFAGYNQYRWDGKDSDGDRVANGTYVYRLVVKSSGGDREALGRIVKLD